ncbi:MAG: glycosyltransferase family 2 protein [Proteobacteria bacterium]|nr:glycosyltransferase family 2 protein [Pseudomonadota bacterium]MCP4915610.1 glycosyltransferase family 2 protein [Pseudomonadota bacterium]
MRPLVVIPSKDNVESVADVAARSLQFVDDVIVVDDGSTDGTGDAARAVCPVLTHPVNLGKGAALTTALRHAKENGFTHLIAVDADGQHLPEDLPLFLEAIERDPWAIHLGVRDMKGAPEKSHFGRKFSNFWIWVETGHHVGDSQTGYRVYPVEPVLSMRLPEGRYEWEVKVLTRALWAGIAVRDVACRVFYPPEEERVTSFRPFWDNVRISLMNTRLVLGRVFWPPRWVNRVPAVGSPWQGGHRGKLAGWRFFVTFANLVGRWPAYACMTIMATFYYLMSGEHRRGAHSYLRRRFPEDGRMSLSWRGWRLFYSFSCSLIDRFLLMKQGHSAFVFEREGTDEARAALADSGAIILSAHLGNPDLGAGALRETGPGSRPVNMVQYAGGNDPYVQLMREMLGDKAPKVIAINTGSDMASMEVFRALQRGEIVALKADRLVDDRTVEVPFLGETMKLPAGPFLLAALSKAPVFIMGCFKEDSRTYRVVATEPRVLRFTSRKERNADIQRWATEFAEQLERWTKRWPHQWYNFHDPWS